MGNKVKVEDNGYRILSYDASEIYDEIQKNGEEIGVIISLDKNKINRFFHQFSNSLDWSLDSQELANVYRDVFRNSNFAIPDEKGFWYTSQVVNVSFEKTTKDKSGKRVTIAQLREYLYDNGFVLGGYKYVRYKSYPF